MPGCARLVPSRAGQNEGVDNVVLAEARSERGEVALIRRARDHGVELRVNGIFVMDDVETSSERMLARAALSALPDDRALEVLVGGLGLGFTLSEVLTDRRVRRVVVAEIESAVVRWHRDGTLDDLLDGRSPIHDDRVHLAVDDVRAVITGSDPGSLDVVLLDVDNGPGYLVHDANADVYRSDFLHACAEVLRPDGLTAVWSAAPAPDLLATMQDVFVTAEEWPIPVILGQRATTYHLFLGRAGD